VFFKTWTTSRASGAAFSGLVYLKEGQEEEDQGAELCHVTGSLLGLQLPRETSAGCWCLVPPAPK